MFMLDRTWEVITDPDDPELRRLMRVPNSRLEDYIAVLLFNGVEDFRVMVEAEQAPLTTEVLGVPLQPYAEGAPPSPTQCSTHAKTHKREPGE